MAIDIKTTFNKNGFLVNQIRLTSSDQHQLALDDYEYFFFSAGKHAKNIFAENVYFMNCIIIDDQYTHIVFW